MPAPASHFCKNILPGRQLSSPYSHTFQYKGLKHEQANTVGDLAAFLFMLPSTGFWCQSRYLLCWEKHDDEDHVCISFRETGKGRLREKRVNDTLPIGRVSLASHEMERGDRHV